MTLPDASNDAYQYDTLNRLKSLTDSLTGQFNFSYDTLSRRTSLTRPNGVNTSYGYDSLSRLLSVLHKSGANTLDGASYTYDSAGNRTAKTNSLNSVTEQYTYDPLYQLRQVTQGTATTESYNYDSVGNRLSSLGVSSCSYNSSNELTSTSVASFTYDANGNTLTKTDSTGTRTYGWDFENRLTSVALPGSGGTVTFKYDPFGRRVQKISPSGTTNYLYDGANVVKEIDASGNDLARYTQGRGIDEPLAALRSGTASYYEQDGLGSVTSLSSLAGALANTYAYDAFGNLTASTGSLSNPFQYTSRDSDAETGLRYYRGRFYDPGVGRFLSEDPIGFDAGVNFYTYVENNPINSSDPFGLCPPNKTKRCGVKTVGYDKTGAVPKNTTLQVRAEFLNDNTHDPNCCEIRQKIWWNKPFSTAGSGGPHVGFFGEDQPRTWHEDRAADNTRMGHRGQPDPVGAYQGNGYIGMDTPGGGGIAGLTYPNGLFIRLRLVVVDVCNGGKKVATGNTVTVNF